jgi:hypothetical protein
MHTCHVLHSQPIGWGSMRLFRTVVRVVKTVHVLASDTFHVMATSCTWKPWRKRCLVQKRFSFLVQKRFVFWFFFFSFLFSRAEEFLTPRSEEILISRAEVLFIPRAEGIIISCRKSTGLSPTSVQDCRIGTLPDLAREDA